MRLEDCGYGDSDIAMMRESSLIHTFMNGAKQVRIASGICVPEMFFFESTRTIYQCLINRMNEGLPIDTLAIASAIRTVIHQRPDDCDKFLNVFFGGKLNNPVNSFSYACDIREAYNRGQVKGVAGRFVNEAEELQPGEAIGATSRRLETLQGQIRTGEGTTFADAVETASELTGPAEGGISTGIATLDDIVDGIVAPRLITIAARSGSGKTSLAVQLAVQAAKQDARVVYFSYEMQAHEIAWRAATQEARLPQIDVSGGITAEDEAWRKQKIRDAATNLTDLPMQIFDNPMTVEQLCPLAKQLHSEHPVGLLVVDYLGIMPVSTSDRKSPRSQQIGNVTRQLKSLAMAINVPVIALCQVNREGSKDDWLRTHHLRDSSDVENDSDQVWFIQSKNNTVSIDIAKNRHGRNDYAEVFWRPHQCLFTCEHDFGL